MALKHRQRLRFIAAFAFATAAIFIFTLLSGCAGSPSPIGFYSDQSFTAAFTMSGNGYSAVLHYERNAETDTDVLTISEGALSGIVYTFSPAGDSAAYGGAVIPLKPAVSAKLKAVCAYFKAGEESLLSVSAETVNGKPCTAAEFGNNSGTFTVYLSDSGLPVLILAGEHRMDISDFTVRLTPNDQ